jgi:hypothetical protein
VIHKTIMLQRQSFPARIGCQALVIRAVPCRETDRRLVLYESKTHLPSLSIRLLFFISVLALP